MTRFGKVGVQFAKVPVEANLRSNWLRSKVVVLKHWSSSESWRRAAFTVTIMGCLPPREFDSVCPSCMLTKTLSDSDAGGLRPHFERKTDLKVSYSQPALTGPPAICLHNLLEPNLLSLSQVSSMAHGIMCYQVGSKNDVWQAVCKGVLG